MERLQVTTLTDQDLSSAALVATFEATADAELLINLHLSGLAGSGVYRACLTKLLGGAGEAYQSATTVITLSESVTTAYLPTTPMAVQAGDVVKVYAQGLEADTAVSGVVEVFDVTACTAQDVWDALVAAQDTDGSLGQLIADYLDAAISSRATPSDVTVSLAVSATEAAAVASGTAAIKPYHDWSQTFLSTVTADLASATKIWTVGKADRDNNTDAEALFFIEEAEGLTVLAQAACASTGLGALAISGSSGDWEITVTLSAAATAALVQWRHKKGMTMSIKALVNGKTVDVWEGTLTISSATARAYS